MTIDDLHFDIDSSSSVQLLIHQIHTSIRKVEYSD